ncbi:arginase family hydrolase, arginase/agmainase/formiminoglutamate hydrolase [Thermanaerovibrio velox DSM 12556]|uniref:Arginase family hydrolase, arginase/agmainase/formiminoglutamate hydrolase n=1 Tax=Thermanaerovibrio velox DSM 12556 TaxID=926567 RepID=H0UPX4_9BACT|nr:formimidoylglutamase [Thermanaerovibrio velox]EHM10683.1 arginase family hydrolase, arginase/agmainase/formiminoglutamate hydrolase [Thermanaerovibrio velox DSM 12556]
MDLFDLLTPPDRGLFFSKGDPKDPRMGELVVPVTEGGIEAFDVVIVGMPDDRGVRANKGRPGARLAPDAVRRAFYRFTPGFAPSLGELKIADVGNVKVDGLTIEEAHDALRRVVRWVVSCGVIPIVIGGGHDNSYPGLWGLAEGLGLGEGELGVVNVDQHLDVRDLSWGGITSGTPFYRSLEEMPMRAVSPKNFVEYAIQEAHNSPYYYDWLSDRHATVMTFDEIQGRPMETFIKALQIAGRGTRAIAVSVDIDSVRSTDAPGASAVSPNGLSSHELNKVAYLAGRSYKVKYLDIMEISPPLDQDQRTASLGADVIFRFLKGMCERR